MLLLKHVYLPVILASLGLSGGMQDLSVMACGSGWHVESGSPVRD